MSQHGCSNRWRLSCQAEELLGQAAVLPEEFADCASRQKDTTQYLISDLDSRNHRYSFFAGLKWREEYLTHFYVHFGTVAGQFKEDFFCEKTPGAELGSVEDDVHNCLVNMGYGPYTR